MEPKHVLNIKKTGSPNSIFQTVKRCQLVSSKPGKTFITQIFICMWYESKFNIPKSLLRLLKVLVLPCLPIDSARSMTGVPQRRSFAACLGPWWRSNPCSFNWCINPCWSTVGYRLLICYTIILIILVIITIIHTTIIIVIIIIVFIIIIVVVIAIVIVAVLLLPLLLFCFPSSDSRSIAFCALRPWFVVFSGIFWTIFVP